MRVGNQYGSVFELLQARSFNDWVQDYEQDKERMARLTRFEDKIRVAASIRFLYLMVATPLKDTPLAQARIAHTREHLQELLGRVDSLDFT